MPLTLVPPAHASAGGVGQASRPAETRLDHLLKLIPTEVLAVYPAVLALAAVTSWPYYESAIAALGVVAVVLMLHRDGTTHRLQPMWQQHVVRCLTFAAWTLLLGNPLHPLSVRLGEARVFGATGVVFVPVLGYLTLPGRFWYGAGKR